MSDANVVLIPEVPFQLEGESGLLAFLKRRLSARGHAVVVVAEGAGQELMESTGGTDVSGNKKLTDVGPWLSEKITKHLQVNQF